MNISETLTSIAKIALHPRRATVRTAERKEPIIILGNGPSLNDTMRDHADSLKKNTLLAVNYSANTPVFTELKPEFYVLADPHFFEKSDDPNVELLIKNLDAVTWRMTLCIPFGANPPLSNPLLTIERFPMTGVEGSAWIERLAYSLKVGMPRPRNVLIPSIMLSIWLGFKQIYIVGADHSWMESIHVNERNEVVSIQPHYYEEDEREVKRSREVYMHIRLHEVIHSFYVAFRAYHQIQRYVQKRGGMEIFNSTPVSYIDAFPRRPLP